jgi:hypothetical protein
MLIESGIIAPHGGYVVDRRAPEGDRRELAREALGRSHDGRMSRRVRPDPTAAALQASEPKKDGKNQPADA